MRPIILITLLFAACSQQQARKDNPQSEQTETRTTEECGFGKFRNSLGECEANW